MDYTLNCNGQLLELGAPKVMGILNVTPDSFYADSRQQTERDVAKRVEEILSQGGCFIDVGACSTRPDSEPVSESEEIARLRCRPSHRTRTRARSLYLPRDRAHRLYQLLPDSGH